MSQTCPKCGSPVLEGHRFCANCGQAMVSEASTAPQASTAQDATQPVTYTVQRYEGATSPTQAPVAPENALAADDPYRAFVPPVTTPNSGTGVNSPSVWAPRSTTTTGAIPPPPPASRDYEAPPQTGTGTSAYGNYAPPSSARAQPGAYMPYDANAVRPLEKPTSQRSWLLPVVLASAAVLLLLALGSGYLLLSNNKNVAPSPFTSTLPSNASDDAKVQEVVRISNEEQIKAWRDLDTEVLKGTRIGQVLDENIQMVQMLQSRGMYAVPVNESLQFVDVKVQGDKATVRTVEVWTVTFFKKSDGTTIQKNGPDTLRETYSLVKQNGKWMIDQLQIDGQSSPQPGTTPTLPTT